MTGKFQYSILKYRHSYIAGEVFNIGILFLFNDGKLEFRHPTKFKRLTDFFHTSPVPFIRSVLTSFRTKAIYVSKEGNNAQLFKSDLADIISSYFLTESAGSLFFSDIKTGVYFENEESIIDHYYSLYLGQYEEEVTSRKTEKYIIDKVKSIIKEKFTAQTEKKFKIEKTLRDPNGSFSETFTYGWQNGKLNLITPLSFDLANEQSFDTKAIRWYGILNFLKEPALEENVQFDILLAEPSDPALKKSFLKAKDIIERSDAPVNFVEERKFSSYLEHAVEVVNDHEGSQNEKSYDSSY